MKKSFKIFIHLIFWVLFILNQFKGQILNDKKPFTIDHFMLLDISFVVVSTFTFYTNYFFVLPKVIRANKTLLLFGGLIVNFLIFITLRYSIEEVLYPHIFGFHNYFKDTPLSYYFIDNLYYGSTTVFMSSLIWFLDYSFRLKTQNELLNKQKRQAEISLLKSQINPHFIFNTLNNIYSLVNQNSDKSLQAIEKLSELLRYSGREMDKDKTLLKNEIEYIKNLIDVESLRLSQPQNIIFENKVALGKLTIAPMILIPFVENAFKHGDLRNGMLKMEILNEGNKLIFTQTNKINTSKKDFSSGIGIQNVKKRLELLYPNNHILHIRNDGENFSVILEINL